MIEFEIKKKKVLVVDDNEAQRELYKDTLELAGYSVTCAESAPEGVKLFQKALDKNEPFHLVLTDHQMDNKGDNNLVTGDDLAREIKKLSPDTPIIKITSTHFESTRKDAQSLKNLSLILDKTEPGIINSMIAAVGALICPNSIVPSDSVAKGAKILLVDDEKMVLDVLNKILESGGYSVSAFSNPLDALSTVQNGARFDLAIINHGDTRQRATAGLLDGLQKAGAKFPIIHLVQQDDLQEFSYILKKPLLTSRCLSNMVQQILAAQKPDGTKANVAARKMRAAGLPGGSQNPLLQIGAKTPMQKR